MTTHAPFIVSSTAKPVDLDALGACSGEAAVEMARWLDESHEPFARKTAGALREAYAQNYGYCPWTPWAIKDALLARMKEAS